jgi:hypothetical protein
MICSESLCNREGGAVNEGETFEECSILFKSKEDKDFNPPPNFGELKSESDAEIGRKGTFCKGFGRI